MGYLEQEMKRLNKERAVAKKKVRKLQVRYNTKLAFRGVDEKLKKELRIERANMIRIEERFWNAWYSWSEKAYI